MSKIAMNDATETVDVSVETPSETVDVVVKIVKDDDGYHCVLPDGTVSGVLKIIEDGRTLPSAADASGGAQSAPAEQEALA